MPALTRRYFLTAASVAGAGLAIGIQACTPKGAARTGTRPLNKWVSVSPDGTVRIRTTRVDMGQGSQTGLAQIVADEMDADWSKVRVEMAPVVEEYLDKDGDYFTGGSQSIRFDHEAFADAGAAARAMLTAAAAKRWNVKPESITAKHGVVIDSVGGRKLSFGELSNEAAQLPIPKHLVRKQPSARVLIGKPLAQLGLEEKVTGKAQYGIDFVLPGMLVATLAQCAYFGGKLVGVDEHPARAVKGVRHVVKLENAVAVVADHFWAAKQGLAALSPQWSRPANPIGSDAAMFAQLRSEIGAKDSVVAALDKNTKAAEARLASVFAKAPKIVEAEYQVPLLAHAAMEPMNATAHVHDGICELWAPMQAQGDMRNDLAKALGLPKRAIVLHTRKLGGGFGRRLKTDYGVLAAQVARAVGKPVKLIWTREEDLSHDHYRPASVGRVRAALNDEQLIAALEYTGATTNDTATGGLARNYAIAEAVVRQKQVSLPLQIGAWRSVDPSITVFFIESLVDEIAHEIGSDPLDYRRRLLKNDPRGLRTLEAAAELANWRRAPIGHYQGVAFFGSAYWGTCVTHIVELSIDANNRIALHKVSCAIDPGTAINPQLVRAQVEGGLLLGLSAALGEAITLKNGAVEQKNFDGYSPLRLRSVPEIEVRVMESPGAPLGGVGEPPVPPAAPALANALFAATGKRIRRLPLSASGYSV
ncbi:MAG TPA: molybdopterin cofactor-binding domain-containing protein [Rhizomicrobium sp.]